MYLADSIKLMHRTLINAGKGAVKGSLGQSRSEQLPNNVRNKKKKEKQKALKC